MEEALLKMGQSQKTYVPVIVQFVFSGQVLSVFVEDHDYLPKSVFACQSFLRDLASGEARR